MAVYGYTKNYKLIKPQFDTDTWHDYEYDNLDTIDAVLSAIFASGDWQGFWKTNTHYDAGGVVIDRDTDTMYKIMVEHTTSEATFAAEFAAHPTYYELWSPNNLAEDWAIKMDGEVSNVDYSSKAYAISSELIDNGSAKEWAINSGAIGTTGEYSAKKYATDAHNDYISMTTNPNVVAVGTNIANVNTVGQSISDVNTVAGDISSVNTVAGVSTDVTTVASIATAVSNVSNIESEVLDVSDNRTDISTVASNISDVNTVAGVSGDVSTVADNDADVTTVATNISDVNTAATNIAAIQAAPTAASNAAASATLAQDWAVKMDGQVASTDYSSKYYATQSATDAGNSHIWAEGTDEQVQALGGTHSSKVWAEQSTNANIALTNSPYTTNRILEIPQDIKLELNNGTLTLKAGSKVYVPNGVSVFDEITTTHDSVVLFPGQTPDCLIFRHPNGVFTVVGKSQCFSGGSAPSGQTYMMWFDTNNGLMKFTSNSGSTWTSGYSLPLGICQAGASNFTSIDQIFNGFGYIGSTVFALPGVKYQYPDFKNADGTNKCGTQTIQNILTVTNTTQNVWSYIAIDKNASSIFRITEFDYVYNADVNAFYNKPSNIYQTHTPLALQKPDGSNDGKVIRFIPFSVDSVANSNASNFSQAGRSYLSGLGMPSSRYIDLTLGASGATYTAPANGWFTIDKHGTSGQVAAFENTSAGQITWIASLSLETDARISVPAKKGDVVKLWYNVKGTTNYFRFIYAQGEQ